jgi:hypothetical protein
MNMVNPGDIEIHPPNLDKTTRPRKPQGACLGGGGAALVAP